jgi:hypothetical protein
MFSFPLYWDDEIAENCTGNQPKSVDETPFTPVLIHKERHLKSHADPRILKKAIKLIPLRITLV